MADDDDKEEKKEDEEKGEKKGKKGKKGDKGENKKCTKKRLVILFGICLFFLFACGVAEVIYGIYHENNLIKIANFVDGKYHVCPLIVIGCGIVLIIASFVGLIGATRNKFMLLVAFFRTVLITGLIEFICFIIGFVFIFDMSGIYEEKLKNYIKLYTKFYEAVDLLQITLKCCGFKNATDYSEGYPSSCCKIDTKVFCSDLYDEGCKNGLHDYIRYVGLTFMILCFIGLCIKACACAVCWFFGKKVSAGVDYGDDEDPEKLKRKEERKQKKKERRKKKRKEKREKKKKKAEAFQKKEEEKQAKKDKKNKKKISPYAVMDTRKNKKEKPEKEKKEKPEKEKKEKPKKEKKEKPEKKPKKEKK